MCASPCADVAQVYGDGASVARAGAPTTVFLRLQDRGNNTINDSAVYQQMGLAAQLIPQPDQLNAAPVPVTLSYSEADNALAGSYTAQLAAVHVLTVIAGTQEASTCLCACTVFACVLAL